jgi:hypothetical protein
LKALKKEWRFLTDRRQQGHRAEGVALDWGDGRDRIRVRQNNLFSTLTMVFVSSLSWQIFGF